MWYVVASVALFFLLPGVWVHYHSLRFLKKTGENDALWQSMSPFSLLVILFIAVPMYSVTFFALLLSPAAERAEGIQTAYKQMKPEGGAVRLSVVHGIASVFGIKLEE